jgi:ABC-type uncharacterized transport system involved in gliding motility auxiliary subunit
MFAFLAFGNVFSIHTMSMYHLVTQLAYSILEVTFRLLALWSRAVKIEPSTSCYRGE